MSKNDVYKSAERLALEKPYDQITFAEVAESAGVHWTTVRRYFGGKTQMRDWLRNKQTSGGVTHRDTRYRIIEAAGSVFSEQGYNQASLDLVAESAGMTKGAVYWHFTSKQELFLALLEQHLHTQIRMFSSNAHFMLESEHPQQSLENWLKMQLGGLSEPQGYPGLFMEFVVASREPDVRARLVRLQREFLQGVSDFIAELQNQDKLNRQADPQHAALLIDSIMKGTAVEWMIDPEKNGLDTYIETVSSFLWEYFRPDKPSL
ncbi:TetR family transcriptional regulator [Paenibacillus daejeonensis]|uniref:TetR family transcriptional regulator n=1 Tax=Paenibacillus daejeonensis TaxID=135193 RepID=UPI0003818350|nr:TetR family transcriptional regulator [Paenibacillus daejeonensis]